MGRRFVYNSHATRLRDHIIVRTTGGTYLWPRTDRVFLCGNAAKY